MKALVFASMLALPAAAFAAEAPSVRGEKVEPLAAQAMRNFAICAADRTPAGAAKLLASDFRDKDYGPALERFAKGHSYCAPGARMRFSGVLFSGGLAEALLRREVGSADLAPLVALDEANPVQARDGLEMTALCTVSAAPAQAQALFATEPGTPAEAQAASAISPALGQCVAKGQTLEINRPGLRAVLALSAYRLAHRGAADEAGAN